MNQKYIAINEGSYDEQFAMGTLSEIMEKIEDQEWDADDFTYFKLGESVQVEYQKKLVLVEKK